MRKSQRYVSLSTVASSIFQPIYILLIISTLLLIANHIICSRKSAKTVVANFASQQFCENHSQQFCPVSNLEKTTTFMAVAPQ